LAFFPSLEIIMVILCHLKLEVVPIGLFFR